MSEPTVVVVEDQADDGDAGAAFAAGVATAEAAQATEDAAEAAQTAEGAAAVAEAALEVAAAADETAWDARTEIDGLRGEMVACFEELRAALPQQADADQPPEGAIPAPEVKESKPEPASDDTTEERHGDEKGEHRYGNRRWFG